MATKRSSKCSTNISVTISDGYKSFGAQIEGKCHFPPNAVIPPTFQDLFSFVTPEMLRQPAVPLAQSLLRSLKSSRPESSNSQISIAVPGCQLSVYDHSGDSSCLYQLQFYANATMIRINGRLGLDHVPTLGIIGLLDLKKEFRQAVSDYAARGPSSETEQRVLADLVASHFTRGQHEFLVHGVLIRHSQHHRKFTSYNFVNYGRPKMDFANLETLKADGKSRFFIALGSNVGDRLAMIEKACLEMEKEGVRIVRTSGLWETKAMYVEDQANFLNGVCEVISTDKDPEALLIKLKSIEERLGRVKLIEKGPRSIDLDVLLWNHESFEKEGPELPISVPHKLMREREFVLRPLCELIPDETLPSLYAPYTFATYLSNLLVKEQPSADDAAAITSSMSTQVRLSPSLTPLSPLDSSRNTRIMSILNVTPDSFSDGGVNDANDRASLKATIISHLENGATIIDIGGQTSKPNAVSISAEEEISRVLPAILVVKEIEAANPHYSSAISVDTYRASVAKTAIEAGAHIVNDISAGLLDPDMLPTVAKLGCTYIMMHMRGTPSTMTSAESTTYNGDLIQIIGSELLARVQAAEAAGIRRWRMILDPGIGFAKTQSQNLELLRRFGELRDFPGLKGIPWLVGASRKRFIGQITGVKEAKERVMGTAATMVAAVQGGADIVRVHDVKEMVEVMKMADALYRGNEDAVAH